MRKDRNNIAAYFSTPLTLLGKPLYFLILFFTIGLTKIYRIVKQFSLHFKKVKITRPHRNRINTNSHVLGHIRKKENKSNLKSSPPPTPIFTIKSLLKNLFLFSQTIERFNFNIGRLVKRFNAFLTLTANQTLNRLVSIIKTPFRALSLVKLPRLPKIYPKTTSLKIPQKPIKSPPSIFNKPLSLPKLNFFAIITSLTIIVISIGFYSFILQGLPHPKELVNRRPPVTTKIFDRQGNLLYKIYKNENRSIVSLDNIPPHVIKATLAIEDSEFYHHAGFSIKGIARALKLNLTQDKLQGGSTITQQLVKNTLLNPEKTLERKAKELVLALAVESYFTKDEILTMYFNEVGYGGPAYGIEEAAQYYFDKPVADLNLAESALLAGLPAAPTTYSPYGTNPEQAINRQHEVLRRMVEEGYISSPTAEKAKQLPLAFTNPTTDIRAPHFVMYAKDKLVNLHDENVVNQGGLEVVTSLDLDIQQLAEVAVSEELEKLHALNVTNAAVLVTNPKTGEILAMVGSNDYFDTVNDGQVNVSLRPRQPGSSIKVITYTLALENSLTPSTIIDDSPVTYQTPGSPPYSPKNYDGRFHGKVTLRQALANSYNVPAVKTLNQLGVGNLIDKAESMGITTWDDRSRFGLSLTLGGGEVKMVDMAVAYGTLANLGQRVDLNPILSTTDYSHTYDTTYACNKPQNNFVQAHAANDNQSCPGQSVVDSKAAYLITDILSDNQARSTAFGTNSILNIPGNQVAVKTGTTNSLRDNWTIGYTSDYVVVVWVGNNDNTPMSRVASGVTGASPIWNRIMTALLEEKPHPEFDIPQGLVKTTICPLTNTLACNACPNPKVEYFVEGTEPKKACNDDQINRILKPTEDQQSPQPNKPSQKPTKTPRRPNYNRIIDRLSTH